MQTWARRGVHAALVTGGMLAVGTGVAAAAGACPDGPAPPLGESVLPPALDGIGDGTPRHSGPCFAGELFPDQSRTTPFNPVGHDGGRHAEPAQAWGKPVTVIAGTIDPMRDLLPAVENDMTREMPVITDDAVPPLPVERSVPVLELAGWVAEPSTVVEQPRGKHAQRSLGTPSEGFHRSLSWAGGIGDVVRESPEAVGDTAFRPDSEIGPELVVPSTDPAVVDEMAQSDGIVALWKGALGRGPEAEHDLGGALLDYDGDLTSGELAGPRHALHPVPPRLLADAVSAVPRALASKRDSMPLRVPGEKLAKASEIPSLEQLVLREGIPDDWRVRSTVPMGNGLPRGGPLDGHSDDEVAEPAVSRIAAALSGAIPQPRGSDDATSPFLPRIPAFTDAPLLSAIEVIFLDELTAAMPELRQVTENPFRTARPPKSAPRAMALPMVDNGSLPQITALQGETLSPPLGIQVLPDLVDTVVFERI